MRKTVLALVLLSTLVNLSIQSEEADEKKDLYESIHLDHSHTASAVLHGHTMSEDDFFKELKKEKSEFLDV